MPTLTGADHIESTGPRHTYQFNTETTVLPALLEQAAAQTQIIDVETERPDIDDVIADLYEGWLAARVSDAGDSI